MNLFNSDMDSHRLQGARIFLALIVCLSALVSSSASERMRVMVETDLGGDPDDEQSLVRFLLYCNEWDVEGIIANRAQARTDENKNVERTGLGIARRIVNAYGECCANLTKHDARFPTSQFLLSRTVPGYDDTNDGIDLILKAVDSTDVRPLWFMNWGTDAGSAPSNLKRALDHVLKTRGMTGYQTFKKRLRLSSDDQFGEHTSSLSPPFPIWIDTFRPSIEGRRWYHQFSAITSKAGGFDLMRDVIVGHGPLGALYPTNTTHWQKEGDSMTFLYLIPTGMNDPEHPTWGSWAGRYGVRENAASSNYFWANQLDGWNGTTNRNNTLLRWAADLQNDFRARLDWCVGTFEKANHKPVAVIGGDTSTKILTVTQSPTSKLQLSAKGSIDPDGDSLEYEWIVYPEVSSYKNAIKLTQRFDQASLDIPAEANGKSIHLILRVQDSGKPALASYRRLIVQVQSGQ